jgi:hypothetical protein
MKLRLFCSDVRLFQGIRGFFKFPDKWRLLNSFSRDWKLLFRNVRLLKDIFREVEAFFKRCSKRNGDFYKDFNYF